MAIAHRRRAENPGVVVAQEMEAAHQVLVEDGHFTIEHEEVGAELGNRGGERKRAVVDSVAGKLAGRAPSL
jgi:hypothetical protein